MRIEIEIPLNPVYLGWIQVYVREIEPSWSYQERRGYQGDDDYIVPILDAEFTLLQEDEKSQLMNWLMHIPAVDDPICVSLKEAEIIAVCRAITSLRLWIRENRLKQFSDETLESGLLSESDGVSRTEATDWNGFQILAFIQESLLEALS